CGFCHQGSSGRSAGARAIFHHNWLPDLMRELVEHDPADHVLGVAGRQRDDGPDVVCGPSLREGGAGRRDRECEAKQSECLPDSRDYHRILPSSYRAGSADVSRHNEIELQGFTGGDRSVAVARRLLTASHRVERRLMTRAVHLNELNVVAGRGMVPAGSLAKLAACQDCLTWLCGVLSLKLRRC